MDPFANTAHGMHTDRLDSRHRPLPPPEIKARIVRRGYLFEQQVVGLRHLDCVDVAKRCIATQHFHKQQPENQLLHGLGRQVGLRHFLLQRDNLLVDNVLLVHARLGSANGLDHRRELLGAHRHREEVQRERERVWADFSPCLS